MKRIGILSQLVPPKPHWTASDVPEQTRKVALITGGDSGIGKETARVLLQKGANVYITSKSGARARSTIDELKRETQKDTIFFLRLDLTDLDSVKTAADEFMGKEQELHTLYNNDGISSTSIPMTGQGHEILFGTNVLAHFYLTKLLLPLLQATAKKSQKGSVRIVNVSSISHYMAAAEGIRWATLGSGEEARVARSKLGSTRLNGQSKLGTILFSNQLSQRYFERDGIVSISLFPGALNADIGGHAGVFLHRVKQLLVAAICLAISGGNFASLTDDLNADNIRNNVVGTVNSRVRAGVAAASPTQSPRVDDPAPAAAAAATATDPLSNAQQQLNAAQDHLTDFSNASLRALTSLYAGTCPDAGNLSGKYLTAWARVTLPHRKALLNNEIGVKLWDWCEARIEEHEKGKGTDNQVTKQVTNQVSEPAASQPPTGAAECVDTKGTKEIEEVKEVKDAKEPKEAEEVKEKS